MPPFSLFVIVLVACCSLLLIPFVSEGEKAGSGDKKDNVLTCVADEERADKEEEEDKHGEGEEGEDGEGP